MLPASAGFFLSLLFNPNDGGNPMHQAVYELHGITSQKTILFKLKNVSLLHEPYLTERYIQKLLGWCTSLRGFCLRPLFPNKNCKLAMYNTPFYSFRFPLANLFGIF
jgi:hypothetical protein